MHTKRGKRTSDGHHGAGEERGRGGQWTKEETFLQTALISLSLTTTQPPSQHIHRGLGMVRVARDLFPVVFRAAQSNKKSLRRGDRPRRCCAVACLNSCLPHPPTTHPPTQSTTHHTHAHRTLPPSCQARGGKAPTARASPKMCSTPSQSRTSQPGSGWPKWCSPGAATSCRYVRVLVCKEEG